MRARRPQLALCAAALLAGCGNDRTPPPDVATPVAATTGTTERSDAAGLEFTVPVGWNLRQGEPPLVATITSGRASVSIFRYPRTEPLPRSRAELDDAVEALAGAARQRDPGFRVVARDRARVDGRPAVVLRGTEVVAGEPRTVRSTHVYAFGGEVVVDAFAPAEDFPPTDAGAFRALVRSLRLTDPGA